MFMYGFGVDSMPEYLSATDIVRLSPSSPLQPSFRDQININILLVFLYHLFAFQNHLLIVSELLLR